MDNESFKKEIAEAQKRVSQLRVERDELRRKFETRERRAARLSHLCAEEEKMTAEIRALRGENPDDPDYYPEPPDDA
jgi:Tfp pilus assembly protein PilO